MSRDTLRYLARPSRRVEPVVVEHGGKSAFVYEAPAADLRVVVAREADPAWRKGMVPRSREYHRFRPDGREASLMRMAEFASCAHARYERNPRRITIYGSGWCVWAPTQNPLPAGLHFGRLAANVLSRLFMEARLRRIPVDLAWTADTVDAPLRTATVYVRALCRDFTYYAKLPAFIAEPIDFGTLIQRQSIGVHVADTRPLTRSDGARTISVLAACSEDVWLWRRRSRDARAAKLDARTRMRGMYPVNGEWLTAALRALDLRSCSLWIERGKKADTAYMGGVSVLTPLHARPSMQASVGALFSPLLLPPQVVDEVSAFWRTRCASPA